VWTSTPPGKTIIPLASMVCAAAAPAPGSAAMRTPSIQTSLTTPSTPFAGS
jgi:hypothetical protein